MTDRYGLILDVDGVIADTEAVNAVASIKMFEDLFGIPQVRREDFEAGLGRGAEAYVLAAARVHNVVLSPEQVELATATRQQYFLQRLLDEPLPAFPGVIELIEQAIGSPDVRVGIATSSTREKSQAVLDAARIPYQQLTYITGSDVTRKKPDPELFLVCAEKMGVPACRCVVVEDAPNGVEAAKAAGSRCIAVTNSTTAEHLTQADLVTDSLVNVSVDIVMSLVDGPA